MIKTAWFLALLAAAIAPGYAHADDRTQDGTYDALVTTRSGTYSVPVEVDSGEVTHVHWPNGGHMDVINGELDGGVANGFNLRGDPVQVEINDSSYDDDSTE